MRHPGLPFAAGCRATDLSDRCRSVNSAPLVPSVSPVSPVPFDLRGRFLAAFALLGLGACVACGLPPAALARGPDSAAGIYANRPPNIFRHNIGLLDLMVTNIGVIGRSDFVDQYGAGWRGGEYLSAASLWVGAVASDNLPYVSTGAYEYEFLPSLDPVDTIYPTYEGAPGGNRYGMHGNADDDGDGRIDEDFLNGRDDDRDGAIDEDYAAASQQMFSCEYWDYTDEARRTYPDHRPLNLRIRQRSYAWSTPGTNEFVGFDFDVLNEGFELLRNVYVGFFVDADAGPPDHESYWEDDGGAYAVIETTFVDRSIEFTCTQRVTREPRDCSVQRLRLDLAYIHDVRDDGENALGGDVPGYFGGMFLGHTTDPSGETAPSRVEATTVAFFNRSDAYPAGEPADDAQRYDLLQSGRKPSRPTGVPSDYRFFFSAGPFRELPPGGAVELQFACVIGEGRDGMVRNAVNAQRVYNGQWRDADESPATSGEIGAETCLIAPEPGRHLTWSDPCDSLAPRRIVKETECIPENYEDADCDCCTPLYTSQREALTPNRETLVHWVGTVAPPPPATNLDPDGADSPGVAVASPAGDRRVLIAWDNISEITPDPISGEVLFSGYRIWRVEGWRRPVGAPGPVPTEWQLIADLSEDPPDGLGPRSPWSLPNFRQRMDPEWCKVIDTRHGPIEICYFPVGRYVYTDTVGLKNGMLYFYDVTAYSRILDPSSGQTHILSVQPTATEGHGVVPTWAARAAGTLDGVYAVPNPWIAGENPAGWDLGPNNADPTGTKVAIVGLPAEACRVRIYTLAGDLVQTLAHDGRNGLGAVYWNLVTRNGQDVVSGVYVYSVECGGRSRVGRLAIIR